MYLVSKISSKNKYIRFRSASQVWVTIDPTPVAAILQNPKSFFNSLTEAERAVLNYLLVWSNSYRDMYFAQSTIGDKLGYSRATVNRALGRLQALGLIAANYRSYQKKRFFRYKSSQYKVSTWFNNLDLRESLKGMFEAFWWFPIAVLSITHNTLPERNVTQRSNNIYIYNQSTVCKRGLPAGIHPTRVERMESWKMQDDHLPPGDPFRTSVKQQLSSMGYTSMAKATPAAELFRDPRLVKPTKYPQKQQDTTGSIKSNTAVRREMTTQEFIRKESTHKKVIERDERYLALLTEAELLAGIETRKAIHPLFGELEADRYHKSVLRAREKYKTALKSNIGSF